MIQKVFADIEAKKPLLDFRIAREMRKGVGQSLVDAFVLQPNVVGFGVDLKQIIATLFRSRRDSKTA